jgi:SAM-dependent methyltransferase
MDRIEQLWEKFGEENPYYAVLSFDKFNTENLDGQILQEFFASGEEYTEKIWSEIKTNLCPTFHPRRSLDFGCGVGRLAIPIAKRSEKAVGVDISQMMLDEAQRNSSVSNVENIEFIKGDDNLSRLQGKFDFVHSFIVIQHINPKIGENIFKKLIDLIDENGIGALHLTYDHPGKKSSVLRYKIYRTFPFLYSIRNLVLRKKKEPLIPVYTYDLNRIFDILQSNNCHRCFIRFSEHGHKGIHIFFVKKKELTY